MGAVPSARKALLAQPYQDALEEDASLKTVHVLAPAIEVETALGCLTAAQTEATRLFALYSVRRDRLEIEVAMDPAVIPLIDLGSVVQVTTPRYGYTAGALFRVIGIELDPRRNRASLTLWG